MAGATEAISLLDVCKETGHEMALLATYNVHFPFFEHVVVPHLRSSGCRFLVLLMDARQLSRALQSEDNRPQSAGKLRNRFQSTSPALSTPNLSRCSGRTAPRYQ